MSCYYCALASPALIESLGGYLELARPFLADTINCDGFLGIFGAHHLTTNASAPLSKTQTWEPSLRPPPWKRPCQSSLAHSARAAASWLDEG